jgi:broad specificity phosphatase PhoE
VNRDGFRAWRAAYEAAGIRADETAPAHLRALAARADLVLTSDAARAIDSARRLAPASELMISPLLRELDLDGPALLGLTLPLAAWALAVGARAFALTLRRRYPAPSEAARLRAAAAWVDGLAPRDSRPLEIVAVTHASFRRRLAEELRAIGWRAEPGAHTLAPWSVWGYSRSSS